MQEILIPMAVIGLIGAFLGLILSIASKLFEVVEDPRFARVAELLPGYNCGACGFAGCQGLANALVSKEAKSAKLCKPSTQEQRDAIVAYLAETPGLDGETIVITG